MTLEELKKTIIDGVNDYIKDEVLDNLVIWLKSTGINTAKEITSAFVVALKEKAATESGWLKFRDALFLPALLNGTIYLVEKTLNKLVPDKQITAQ